MKKIQIFIFLFFALGQMAFSGENTKRLSYMELKEKVLNAGSIGMFDFKFDLSGRKITGLVYSAVVPGTGQFYLGHEYKGAAFTVLSVGCLVTAIISQNNLIAMNERLESLENDYAKASTFTKAHEIWGKMVTAKEDADNNYKIRNIFTGIFAGIWAINIVDYIFLSPDKGVKDFSYNKEKDYSFDLGFIQNTPTVSLSINF